MKVSQIRCRTEMDGFANHLILYGWYQKESHTLMAVVELVDDYLATIEVCLTSNRSWG